MATFNCITGPGLLNPLAHLDQKGRIMAEYVWLGGATTTGGLDIRGKTMTLDKKPTSVSEMKIWNYDGSSTGQAPGKDSEVMMRPVRIFPDPFRGGDNIIVLCEALLPLTEQEHKDGKPWGKPIPTNSRTAALATFEKALGEKPWFGIEQEYTLIKQDGIRPFGFPETGFPAAQGPYYCGAGFDSALGRPIVEAHYKACLFAGITISGINAEVMPGQWEYQVGPCVGIDSGDELWMSRYLMIRVCEMMGVNVTFDPKPMSGDWNGAGCHTNYSTEKMRQPGGYAEIIKAIEKLGAKHDEHIKVYGEGNERRLTGAHETAPMSKFSYGVANRGASIRIPRDAERDQMGYFEDRRPASNMDPYVVTAKIFDTTCL
jgi:glutamine synthetase